MGGIAALLTDRTEAMGETFVVVLVETENVRRANRLRETLSSSGARAVVRVVSNTDLLDDLRSDDPPSAIVDMTWRHAQFTHFKKTVWVLPEGGLYVAVAPNKRWTSSVRGVGDHDPSSSTAANKRRRELAESIEVLPPRADDLAVVRKTRAHQFTLRHAEVEQTLEQRFGEDWGEVIARRDTYVLNSIAQVVMHGESPSGKKQATISVPSLALRRYRDVTYDAREIMTRANFVLPDSFRHWQSTWLFHKRIHQATKSFGRIEFASSRQTVRREFGEFFTFDSAFPHHFGHMTTETLSRFWGWKIARAENPNLRAVMSRTPNKDDLPDWNSHR